MSRLQDVLELGHGLPDVVSTAILSVESDHLFRHFFVCLPTLNNKKKEEMGRLPIDRTLAHYYDRYMVLVALAASVIVYLQAGMIQNNRSSENVSLASFILFLIVGLSVLVYGMIWSHPVLSLAGLLTTVGATWAVVVTASFRPSANHGAFAR